MSFANTEILPGIAGWFRPLIGRDDYSAGAVEKASKATVKTISMLEEHLSGKTWLVDEVLSLADLYVAGILSRGFQYLFDIEWRERIPNITRWYTEIHKVPCYTAIVGNLAFIDEGVQHKSLRQ